MEFLKCSKDASRPAVSWLNFEPMVSKFPVIGTANAVSITTATWEFLFLWDIKKTPLFCGVFVSLFYQIFIVINR